MADLRANGVLVPRVRAARGALHDGLINLVNTGHIFLDRYFPPEQREQVKSNLVKFATERPYLASFLLSQLVLSGPALILFLVTSISVFVFSLLSGLLVGLIGALIFIAFAIGTALVFLLPTLFMTTFAGVFIWLWGFGTYQVFKWFKRTDVPGVDAPLRVEAINQAGINEIPIRDAGEVDRPRESPPASKSPQKPQREDEETLNEKKYANGHPSSEPPRPAADDGNGGGEENTLPKLGNAQAGNVTKKVSAMTKTKQGNANDGNDCNGEEAKDTNGGLTGDVRLGSNMHLPSN